VLIVAAVLAAALTWGPAYAGEEMFAVDSHVDALYLIDIDSGDTALIGPGGMGIGAMTPVSMARRPSDGALFVTNNSPAGVAGLLRVDPATGLATHIGGSPRSIACDDAGTLYTQTGGLASTGPGSLATIDPTTGALTPLGGPSFDNLLGLDYNGEHGLLYGISERGDLVRIDTDGSVVGTTHVSPWFPGALAFSASGRLILSTLTDELFDIDLDTGTLINGRPASLTPQGLAVVPEPASAALLLLGFAAVARRRFRK